MNDGKLSQEEIDALLNIDHEDQSDGNNEGKSNYELSIEVMDALGEIGNISFGSSATTLSTLLNQKVEITTPTVRVVEKEELDTGYQFEPVSIQVNYLEGFTGNNVFVIKAQDASVIADIMLGGDGTNPTEDLDAIQLSAVEEAMNQMMGTAATSMSTVFDKKIDISPPAIIVGTEEDPDIKDFFKEDAYIQVSFRLMVGDLIDSSMMQLIPIDFGQEMVDQLLNKGEDHSTVNEEHRENLTAETEPEETYKNEKQVSEFHFEEQSDDKPRQGVQPVEEERGYLGKNITKDSVVQEASFAEFEQPKLTPARHRNLDMLLDIPLKVTVELGKTKKSVREILDLSAGSIIELDKLAGEPVDVLVNGKLIAEGEVVVIDENFGVRITDILSTSDRIMSLK
jgi:flagellar motor switch protein FliN/FliY